VRCDHLLSRGEECADLIVYRFRPSSKFNDVEFSGHLSTSKTDERVARIKALVHENIYVTVSDLLLRGISVRWGDCGSTVVKMLCYKSEGRWFDPSWCQWIFHWRKILLIALWPWGRLSLKQKWVPGTFPGGKDGQCVRLTLPPSCVVMKSGNLNFLEPSGPLQACNGTALPYLGEITPKHFLQDLNTCWIFLKFVSYLLVNKHR